MPQSGWRAAVPEITDRERLMFSAARKFGFVAVLLFVLVFMAATAGMKAVGKALSNGNKGGGDMAPVMVAKPQWRTFTDNVQAVGNAQANESVTLSSKVTDIVREKEQG